MTIYKYPPPETGQQKANRETVHRLAQASERGTGSFLWEWLTGWWR